MKTKIVAAFDDTVSRFLKWDRAVTPVAPAGYLGDATVTHAMTGSFLNKGYFKLDQPNVGRTDTNSIRASQFTLGSKLYR